MHSLTLPTSDYSQPLQRGIYLLIKSSKIERGNWEVKQKKVLKWGFYPVFAEELMIFVDTRSDGDDSSSTIRMNSIEHFKTHAIKDMSPYLFLYLIKDVLQLHHFVCCALYMKWLRPKNDNCHTVNLESGRYQEELNILCNICMITAILLHMCISYRKVNFILFQLLVAWPFFR